MIHVLILKLNFKGGNIMNNIPINQKTVLTIKEATEYTSIGINKMYEMLRAPNCPFVLFVGTKKLVKREALENYLKTHIAI